LKAQKELHNLAEKIDQVHKEVNEVYSGDNQSCLHIIQDLIDNLDDVSIKKDIICPNNFIYIWFVVVNNTIPVLHTSRYGNNIFVIWC
jgi:hypothetical protein